MVSRSCLPSYIDRHCGLGSAQHRDALIIKDLHADLSLASWLALVYAFVTASLYLPCGRLSDVLGVGKLFLAGFVLYSLSSFAAGMTEAALQMIFFRAMQAAGSA